MSGIPQQKKNSFFHPTERTHWGEYEYKFYSDSFGINYGCCYLIVWQGDVVIMVNDLILITKPRT